MNIVFTIFLFINQVASYTVPPSTTSKFVQEAEIKHGRVAMVSSIVIPLLDNINPDVLGVNYVNSLDYGTQQLLLFSFGVSEICQLLNSYEFPSNTSNWFKIKEEHVPGDYKLDPLNILNDKNNVSVRKNEKLVGRLAMLAVSCQMLSELVTNEPILKF